MKNKRIRILVVLALVLVLSLCVQGAMAYFTTYVVARGGKTVHLGRKTEIDENVSEWTKSIVIKNVGDTNADTRDNDCYVRVKYFAGSQYSLTPDAGDGWEFHADDGYWYYLPILKLGQSTTALNIHIDFDAEEVPDDFNVVVIQENTDVLYTKDGRAYCDWNLTMNAAPAAASN